jgi:hypothetical protein
LAVCLAQVIARYSVWLLVLVAVWAAVAGPRLATHFPVKVTMCRNIALLIAKRIPTEPALGAASGSRGGTPAGTTGAATTGTAKGGIRSTSSLDEWVVVGGGGERDTAQAAAEAIASANARESKAWDAHDAAVSAAGGDDAAVSAAPAKQAVMATPEHQVTPPPPHTHTHDEYCHHDHARTSSTHPLVVHHHCRWGMTSSQSWPHCPPMFSLAHAQDGRTRARMEPAWRNTRGRRVSRATRYTTSRATTHRPVPFFTLPLLLLYSLLCHWCHSILHSLFFTLPLPTTLFFTLPLPTTLFFTLPLPTTLFFILPLPTTPFFTLPLLLPLHALLCHYIPLHSSLFVLFLHIGVHTYPTHSLTCPLINRHRVCFSASRRQRGWSLILEDTPAPASRRPSARSLQSRTLSTTSEESDAPQYPQRGLVENSAGT